MTAAPPRVLVTGGEHVGVLAAVRALRAEGYEPWAAVSEPGTYTGRSRAAAGIVVAPHPSRDPDGFIRALADASARLSVAAVLPGTDSALIALAGRTDSFPSGVAVGACPPATLERAIDKPTLTELAAAAGLATPPTVELSRSDVEAWGPTLAYPAVVKPLRSELADRQGSLHRRTARRVTSFSELCLALEALPGDRVLIQPFLRGRLRAICGVSWEGEVVCAEHQAAQRIWPPDCGISAYAETVPPEPELEAAVARLLASLAWSGIFQAQFIESAGEVYFIDLNPRIYGSLALAIAAGLNLPAIWTALLLGQRPVVDGYQVGVRYRFEEKDVRAVAVALADGRWGSALAGLLPRRDTVHAVFSLRDPAPILASLAKLHRRLTSRSSKG